MSQRLLFPDAQSRDDVLTFAGRAATLTDTTVRLVGERGVLAMTVAALAPRTLMDDTPTVLAMRVGTVDPELQCDVTVDAGLLAAADDTAIALPDVGVRASWSGISPPRGGWTDAGEVDAADLAARARDGIARVAEALTADPGEDLVQRVRAQVWGEAVGDWAGLPLGAGFAAVALGFISGAERVRLFRSGPWTRASLARGHVITRGPVALGITPVRETGIR